MSKDFHMNLHIDTQVGARASVYLVDDQTWYNLPVVPSFDSIHARQLGRWQPTLLQ